MAKTIYADEGFLISDLLAKEGTVFQMNHDFIDNEEEDYSYMNEVHMSDNDILKFLNDDEEANIYIENPTTKQLQFDQLRSNMCDLLGNGLVMKSLKKEGVGETMHENTQVSVRYYGFFDNQAEPFDASQDHGHKSDVLFLGQGAIIPGLEIALLSMKKFEISLFLIKPEYAYGLVGCPPRIPPNQEVLFLVHLLDYKDDDFTTSFHKLSIEDRGLFSYVVKKVNITIAKAREHFNKGKIKAAIALYSKAANTLERASLADENEEIEQKRLLTRVYGNLLICFNKENKPRCACTAFNQLPTKTAKSYFNHGRALIRLGEFGRAIEELHKSKRMEPNSRDIAIELSLVKDLNLKYNSIKDSLKSNCFLVTGSGEVSPEFISAANNLCSTLQNDINVLRIVLPSGLTVDETNHIRQLSSNNNLIVVNHVRYEKENVFIAKPNY